VGIVSLRVSRRLFFVLFLWFTVAAGSPQTQLVFILNQLHLKEDAMHEMSITQGIIDICEQHAAGRRVLSLDVEIGELSSVVPEAIEFCFEACSQCTVLEGARLKIIRISGRGRCQDCGGETPLESVFAACVRCGGFRVVIEAGEEMRVREIEVEE
jgi:hydrogenase nickel incorporation protein HypA/HybF